MAVEPSHWIWEKRDTLLVLTEGVLPHPKSTSLESMLDIWADSNGPKVLSMSWPPTKPWIPPIVNKYKDKGGKWLLELGYDPEVGQK
jgi:hypothetical protein